MERIFDSIKYIEENMYQPITIHDMARAAHFSTYHFCRIFKTVVGDSPKEYLRKRRLTIAADRLVKEPIAIIDLALDCQFESQEAFTRSFKNLFNMTPGKYRKTNEPFRLLYKDQFSPHMLHQLRSPLHMTPNIITQAERKIVGIANRYGDDDLNLFKLWSAFKPVEEKINHRANKDLFGIYEEYSESADDTGFSYICAAEVSEFGAIPDGMITRALPEQLYAVFKHQGPMSALPDTLKYIWGSWLPKSVYEYAEKPDFELFPNAADIKKPERSRAEKVDNIVYLHIPIRAKLPASAEINFASPMPGTSG
jgi:AraC family transcriptional regulator